MMDEMSLAALDDSIEDLEQVIPGAFSPEDNVRHYVVFASNQTEPYSANRTDFTLCGFKSYYGPARGQAPTCMECVTIMDQLQNMGTRHDR